MRGSIVSCDATDKGLKWKHTREERREAKLRRVKPLSFHFSLSAPTSLLSFSLDQRII